MCNEVRRSLVEHLVLLGHDSLFLAEGADDVGTALGLVEVGANRTPERGCNFVKLIVGAQVRLCDEVHESDHNGEADHYFPAAHSDQEVGYDGNVGEHVDAVIKGIDQVALEHFHVLSEDLKNFADWSDIEEFVDRCLKNFLQSAADDAKAHVSLLSSDPEVFAVAHNDSSREDIADLLHKSPVSLMLSLGISVSERILDMLLIKSPEVDEKLRDNSHEHEFPAAKDLEELLVRLEVCVYCLVCLSNQKLSDLLAGLLVKLVLDSTELNELLIKLFFSK